MTTIKPLIPNSRHPRSWWEENLKPLLGQYQPHVIAAMLGVTVPMVHDWSLKLGHRTHKRRVSVDWAQEAVALEQMVRDGKSNHTIAAHYGTCVKSITLALKRLRIHRTDIWSYDDVVAALSLGDPRAAAQQLRCDLDTLLAIAKPHGLWGLYTQITGGESMRAPPAPLVATLAKQP